MKPSTHILQYQIIQAAAQLFVKQGFESVTMAEIAASAKVEEEALYVLYGSKFDIVLELYQRINADWRLAVDEMHETKLHERFERAVMLKLDLMSPFADALAGMVGYLLRDQQVGIGSGPTRHIRAQAMATMRLVIDGAEDAGRLRKKIAQLPAALYLIHWTLMLLHLQGGNREESQATVAMAAKMLQKARNASFLLPLFPFFQDLGQWAERFVGQSDPSTEVVAKAIVQQVFLHRKLILPAGEACLSGECVRCQDLHVSKIEVFVTANEPIHFVLPAFPAKSPNSRKTIGKLPDLGETIALQTLQGLCDEIQAIYQPGARVTICSDGRIFSDLVEVGDDEITTYVAEIRKIVASHGFKSIEIMNLEDLLPEMSIDAGREWVLTRFSESIDALSDRLKSSPSFLKLFNGIHRFIAEDRQVLHPELSATKAKESAKPIALQVIQHSNAWTRLIAQLYPMAIRLSIHPYDAHADKIGIRLTKATDDWLTPWHGAIALGSDGYVLMKAADAVAKGARLVEREGRPSHFTTISP